MSNQQLRNQGNKIIVIGSSGLIGKKVCEHVLLKGWNLVEIGRTRKFDQSVFFYTDLQNVSSIIEALEKANLKNGDGLVFAHRARNSDNCLNLDAFYLDMRVELNPYLALYKVLNNSRFEGITLNLVNISSVAARLGAYDVPFAYHIMKAAQSEAGRMMAYIPGIKIFTNTVIFGEAMNDKLTNHSHFHAKLFDAIKSNLGGKDLPCLSQIAEVIILLCSANLYGLSGQMLSVDSGMSHLSIESVLRHNAKS